MSESTSGAARTAFVSYAAADKATADTLTAWLEERGIRCWIAPRDVPAGALYADAIVRGINEAPALVLLLSRNATGSSHVGKELERASSKSKQIIAVRLDDAPLTPAFEYFLSESQWVDVPAEGRDAGFARVAEALGDPAAPRSRPAVAAAPAALPAAPRRRWPWRATLGALALAVVLAGAGSYFLRAARAPSASAAVADKSIAVLPFTDMSQAHDQEFFADGMAEQILDLLAKIPSVKVIARTSSFQFKGKSEDMRVVGEKLGVATLLEGSVRKAGERLRVTAQLIRTADGSHLWSEVYDREIRDVFRTQDEIAGAVVSALKVSLLGGAPAQRPAPTSNTEAYALYLQGLAHWQRYTVADSTRARESFERAVALDSNFAQAWAALAGVYSDALVLGSAQVITGSDSFGGFASLHDRIAAAARRALAIDPKLADAHVALANLVFLDYDLAASQRELALAVESEPDNVGALGTSIYLAIGSCRLDEAERLAHRLIERDPLSVDPYRGLATALWFKGESAEAAATYRRALAFDPDAASLRARLGLVLISAGKPEEALTELGNEPTPPWQAIGRVIAYDALGKHAEADPQLALVLKGFDGWQYQLAEIYAHRGDRDHAIEWLTQARDIRDPGFFGYVKCDPMLANLRADPRYQALLASLNLPP